MIHKIKKIKYQNQEIRKINQVKKKTNSKVEEKRIPDRLKIIDEI